MKELFPFAFFLLLAQLLVGLPVRGERLALTNALLLDSKAEETVRGVLILDGGKIVARTESLPQTFEGKVVDLGGRFVSPGFNDLHVHSYGNGGPRNEVEVLGIAGTAERMLSVGVTGFLDLSNFGEHALATRDERRLNPSAMLGADFYSAGTAFTCPNGHGTQFPNPAHEVSTPEAAERAVIQAAALAPDVIKLIYIPSHPNLPSIDRQTMEAIVTTAQEQGLQVVAHIGYWEDAMEVVMAGVDALTHVSPDQVPAELLSAMKERDVAVIPTLAVHLDLSFFFGFPDRLGSPVMDRVSLREFRSYYSEVSGQPLSERLERWRRQQEDRRVDYLRSVASLSRAGIAIMTGSDSGNPGTFQGASLHRELALLVEAGLSPWQALRASTTNAAKLLGRRIGLEPGDDANLVVLDRSPIEDIHNTETVSMVILHGEVVDMDLLDLPGAPPGFVPGFVSEEPSRLSGEGQLERAGGRGPVDEGALASGEVKAPSGYLLSHVSIGLREAGGVKMLFSTQTDREGRYQLQQEFTIQPGTSYELVAAYPGFDPVVQRVEASEFPANRDFELKVSRFQEAIVVEALSPTDESLQPQQDFDFLDIVATAGANADPMFVTQTLPGVVKLDEGSGLFVRGGDASELATYLDRALLDHPYRNETPTGGFFGTVDAFELSGLSLSAGGFPARYGNSLSAVLELRTRPPSAQRSTQLTVGLAAISASLESSIGEDTSIRVAATRRDATGLVELNNAQLDFQDPPRGSDFSGRVVHRASEGNTLSVSVYDQSSHLGTELENGNFVGLVDTGDDDRVVLLSWDGMLFSEAETTSSSNLTVSLSFADHGSDVAIGVLDIATEDRTWRGRADLEGLATSWLWRSGVVYEDIHHRSIGALPEVGGDFFGDQGLRLWDLSTPQRRAGGYVEAERSLGSRVAFNLGARFDDWGGVGVQDSAFDPRVSMSIRAGESSHFRFAWGRYHQAPEVEYLSQGIALDGLAIAVSEHRIASWQFRPAGDPYQIRIEAYDKRYDHLPLAVSSNGGQTVYQSVGDGFARGIDVFLGFETSDSSSGLRSGWQGFVAYSYLDAKRLYSPWQDNERFDTPTERFAPDFAIPNTLQIVVHKTLIWSINTSLGVRLATGRPYTPVIGAAQGITGLVPIYDTINSDRLPDFERVDMSASRAFAVGGATSLLGFVGVNDVLDRRNAFRYVYSRDWTERRLARTAFGRTFYFGISLRR